MAPDERSAVGTTDVGSGLRLGAVTRSDLVTLDLPARGTVGIGRASDNGVCLDDHSISRRHAILHVNSGDGSDDPSMRLEDLGSANGTRAGGKRLQPRQPHPVRIGDSIELGEVEIVIRRVAAAGVPAPVSEMAIVEDPAMADLVVLLDKIAAGDTSVVLRGEPGVGKRAAAERLHHRSARAPARFATVDCATLSETVLARTLFGVAGDDPQPGLLERTDGGTLLLDEICDLPAATQAELMHCLASGQVRRSGETESRPVNIRWVATTTQSPQRAIAAGALHPDLFSRLNGISFDIPPLRRRPTEILPLAHAFVGAAAARLGLAAPPRVADAVTELLLGYGWPGNVRELKHAMERAVLLRGDTAIGVEDLPTAQRDARIAAGQLRSESGDIRHEIGLLERQRIYEALGDCDGDRAKAAKLLGIGLETLLARLEQYGISHR